MSLALDIILAAIIVICGWRCFRAGIINGVCGIIAVIIAIYGANLIATACANEFVDMLRPFAVGVVDGALADATGFNEEGLEQISTLDVDKLDDVDYGDMDVYEVSKKIVTDLGIAESAAEGIAVEVSEQCDRIGTRMSAKLTELICERASFVAIFVIAFTLICIVFAVIGNIFDLAFGIPGHENLNHFTGAALGVIKGILIVIVIACFCRYLGLVLSKDTINSTRILSRFVEDNKLASMLGI